MRNIAVIIFCVFILLSFNIKNDKEVKLLKIDGKEVIQFNNSKAVLFRSGMSVNADGSPFAYHPDNIGLDYLSNAGYNGNWWALAVNDKGEPYIQKGNDPAPGYYISTTSLYKKDRSINDPERYVNSQEVPFIVLPKALMENTGIRLGDTGIVYNINNKRYSYVIFADVGPANKIGEGSIALAKRLGINADPKKGGVNNKSVIYLVFPGSGDKKPKTVSGINVTANYHYIKWGGLRRLIKYFN